jgi:hypothetical protein
MDNEELHNLYSSPYIIMMIKSRRIRRVGQKYKILVEEPEGRDHSEDPCVDGRIILKWI